jgi:hypothetical protein
MARAVDKDEIQGAVDRGVAYLKGLQQADGTWPHGEIGLTALATLTLLECDVPAADPIVQRGAAAVRQASPEVQTTYSLALSIMLLDRLGDPADEPLIQAMGVRLLAGQNGTGGWSYACPKIGGDDEVRRLAALARKKNELVARGELARAAPPKEPGNKRELPKEIRDQLALLNKQKPAPPRPDDLTFGGWGDNSNTQFAILGLWVAHRYGIPVQKALAHAEHRFRTSQNGDFGWGYTPTQGGMGGSTATMTCAGLLGLALGHGAANEAVLRTDPKEGKDHPAKDRQFRDPARDPAIRNGLLALSTAIGHPIGKRVKGRIPLQGRANGRAYYFLWSLERVAVAYGLKTIGQKDWYEWGAEILLVSQLADGSWQGEFRDGPDTCFALLFLRRANFARDLSARLKGQVQDPGEVRLKAGGVGGDTLVKGLKPGVDLAQVPATDPPPKGKPVKEKPVVPPAESKELSAEIDRLSKALVQAAPAQRKGLLDTYKESKGVAYTQALAAAIPQLTGAVRAQARDALTDRLAHMSAATLRDKLRDEDLEIRRAAALACAMRDEKGHIPDLIDLLNDSEPPVAWAAHKALKALTGKDYGPSADASRSERTKAIADWTVWWQKNGSK